MVKASCYFKNFQTKLKNKPPNFYSKFAHFLIDGKKSHCNRPAQQVIAIN